MKKTGLILIGLVILLIFNGVSHALIKYTIVDVTNKLRLDGGTTYLVLIPPVNLKNDNFKKDIIQLVQKMANEKGRQITIDFFDDRKVLKTYFRGRMVTPDDEPYPPENRDEVRHHIARFTDKIYVNSWLSFFPMLLEDNNDYDLYGKYYDFQIFNPYE